ncbi:MAG: DNA primase DnaG [Candidatus Thermoplasmatota archaeon]|nr:DNA primase DnaG [Candidatus Thermoplasmatota archaeon]
MNVDPNLTKYLIKAKIFTDGVVEKPDVVGAIFGQTEGLLGEELDLRDLQKSGKIGRIEVEIDSKKGRTEGFALIPSGLDQVESSILAASLETIDRIGPCKAKVEIESIEDVRIQKRQKIVERAEALYKKMSESGKSVSESIVASVREEVEKGEILTYGDEHLPAGPAIKDSDSIIVVEGRSDVLNLLRYGIKNTIAVQGTNIPKTVQKLSRERTVTVFLDGDRGGDLILKEMLQVAEIDFVARAPPGTEVEELTYKQIVKALRYKTPIEQYLSMRGMAEELKELTEKNSTENHTKSQQKRGYEEAKSLTEIKNARVVIEEVKEERPQKERRQPRQVVEEHQPQAAENEAPPEPKSEPEPEKEEEFNLSNPRSVEKHGNELTRDKLTEIYDAEGKIIASYPVSEAVDRMEELDSGDTIITGGVISQRLIDVAFKKGVKNIYGAKLGHITKKPMEVKVVSWERHI